MRSKSKKRARPRVTSKVVTCVAATVMTLAVAEAAVRMFALAPAVKPIAISGRDGVYKRSDNPILGYELRANYRNDDADLVLSYPRTNSHGQRDVERTIDKQPNVRRIVLLGDSVVEGEGIREIDDTISRRLENLFGGGTEVLNFGVKGYCTLAEVELLETRGLKFKPDVVVVLFVHNDFNNFNHNVEELRGADRPRLAKDLFFYSHLFRRLCLSLNLFHYGEDDWSWHTDQFGDNNVVTALDRLEGLAKEHGFDTMIAIWPRFLDDRIADGPFVTVGDKQLIIEALARAHAMPTVRLSPFFKREAAVSKVNPRVQYSINGDQMHPTIEASRIAAAALKTGINDLASLRLKASQHASTEASQSAYRAAVAAAAALGDRSAAEAATHLKHGNEYQQQERYDKAIAAYHRALEIKQDYAQAHYNLAWALRHTDRLDEALRHYRRAVELEPELVDALLALSWLLATHLEAAIRNPQEAVDLAERAAKLTDYRNAIALDTLAAAYASAGRFGAAVGQAQAAAELASKTGHDRLAAQVRGRRQLYRQKTPFRQR